MDGSFLRHGPSVISSLSVEGSTLEFRIVRDSGPKRGRFRGWAARKNSSLR